MALSDIRKFNFYSRYVWNPTDFENFETWLFGAIEGCFEGLTGGAVLSGLRVLPSSGLTVSMAEGIAVSTEGRIIVAEADEATFASPVGNPAKSLLVLRPTLTDATDIPLPTNPSVTVPLHEKLTYDLVVINGTPAANPVYPATQDGDVIVMGVKLTAGHTTIARADLDLNAVSRPRKRTLKIRSETANFSVDSEDEIVELDFSGASGVAQLPAAGDCEGKMIKFVKVDSSVNQIAVSGNGAETISGQNWIGLDTQWQTLSVYSTGLAWRVL